MPSDYYYVYYLFYISGVFVFSPYQQFVLDTSQQKRVHFPKHHKEYKVSNAYLPSPPTMPQQIQPSRSTWKYPNNNHLIYPT